MLKHCTPHAKKIQEHLASGQLVEDRWRHTVRTKPKFCQWLRKNEGEEFFRATKSGTEHIVWHDFDKDTFCVLSGSGLDFLSVDERFVPATDKPFTAQDLLRDATPLEAVALYIGDAMVYGTMDFAADMAMSAAVSALVGPAAAPWIARKVLARRIYSGCKATWMGVAYLLGKLEARQAQPNNGRTA